MVAGCAATRATGSVFDGQPVADSEGLGELIRSHRPGDEVRVGIVRADGSQEELTVRLGVNPVPTG